MVKGKSVRQLDKPVHWTYSGWLSRVKGFSEDTIFNIHEEWDKKYRVEYQKYLEDNGFCQKGENQK
jgi:hypothetical protein